MKILIIANGFTGSTLPLANKLCTKGHEVKCMYMVKIGSRSMESLDFDAKIRNTWGTMVPLSKSNRLYSYLNDEVEVAFLPIYKRKMRMEKVAVGKIFPLVNSVLIKRYIRQIIAEKPDVVNLVVHSYLEVRIARALKNAGIHFTITYHEVLKNLLESRQIKYEVLQTMNLGCPIICHSIKTANDLVELSGDNSLRIHIINFGAFESYLSYGDGCLPARMPGKYLLYIGHIHPYKGLKYLYEAVRILGDSLGNTKVVVAGGGCDKVLDKMKKDGRFVVLNHFIDNAELVGLIRHCEAIVCPYVAASQSGIVQTGMIFGKPVIATKVGAFVEVIRDGVNGLLCEPSDAASLAEALQKTVQRQVEFRVSETPDMLEWDLIADTYVSLYENMIYDTK